TFRAAEIRAERAPSWHPDAIAMPQQAGYRSAVTMPLIADDRVLGVLALNRFEVRPFSDQEVATLESFADQAVIAIENARLFSDLRESLEQQTATAQVP